MKKNIKSTVSFVTCDSYRMENVSKALDRMFDELGMNPENPFKDIVKPGMHVFIKPNWVASRWRESCSHKDTLYSIITHPAIIEAVADRVAKALQGQGEIVIADNPSIDADFEELMATTGICHLEHKYDVPCKVYDLRPLRCPSLDVYGMKDKMLAQKGDPNGEIEVNLGRQSLLSGVDSTLFRGVFDEREDTVAAHTDDKQLYTFSGSFYKADVYISIPKMKTHQKVGATLNLKGLVGTIANKNQLVHWRVGIPECGGDEYPNQASYDMDYALGKLHRGSWPGNDTIWRMVVDLYKCTRDLNRNVFTIVDGICAGEGQGPFCTTSKLATTLIGSNNLLAADIATVRYMGIDPNKLNYLKYFINEDNINLDEDISVMLNGEIDKHFFTSDNAYKDFWVLPQWECIKINHKSV